MSKHKVYTEKEIKDALNSETAQIDKKCELYEADEGCNHIVKSADGGGIECMRCGGWFCC